MSDTPKDLEASIRARLRNRARQQGRPFQEVLQYYAIERFLYRLSKSPYSDRFVLKGGLVFHAWGVPLRRSTRDIDLHGYVANSTDNLAAIVADICRQTVEPDGMTFDAGSIRTEVIQERAEYEGVRLRFDGNLGNAHVPMQVDVGFSDAIRPPALAKTYAAMLDLPAPQLKVYTHETLIAEKFQAMVFHGRINSRMKDFFDLWTLTRMVTINGNSLQDAITTTFHSRGTPIPQGTSSALQDDFADEKQDQWRAFRRRMNADAFAPADFRTIIAELRRFLFPVLESLRDREEFSATWRPNDGWLLFL